MLILIVYASKYGAVKKAANILSGELQKKNLSNTSINISDLSNNNIDLSKYESIIIGGSIYFGKIQKSLIKFCKNNKDTLLNKTISFFVCSGNEKEIDNHFENSFDSELLDHSLTKGYFGYEYNFEKMNCLYKIIVKKIAAINHSEYKIKIENIKSFVNKLNKEMNGLNE